MSNNAPNLVLPSHWHAPGINGHSIIIADPQPSLFDQQKNQLIDTNEIIQPIKSCSSIGAACVVLSNLFKKNWSNLHLFLYAIKNNKKLCLQNLHGFSYLLFDNNHNTKNLIRLRSHWSGPKFNMIGWQNISSSEQIISRNDYTRANLDINIYDVNAIKIWNWGFQIISDQDINIVAAMSYVLRQTDMNSYDWNLPLRDDVKDNKDFKEIVSEWKRA
jgi:hypothetical protein